MEHKKFWWNTKYSGETQKYFGETQKYFGETQKYSGEVKPRLKSTGVGKNLAAKFKYSKYGNI